MEKELKIRAHALGGNGCEAYYFEDEDRLLRAMAIDPDVEPERRRLWELVAHGIERVPATTRPLIGNTHPTTSGFYFFAATKARGADSLAVRAVSEVLEELEPGWVRAVKDARRLADSPEVIAAWSEVPIEAVLAVLGNWRTRL